MISQDPLLIIRPTQGKDESFKAYLTRLSGVNQLAGMDELARRLGLSRSELVAIQPVALKALLSGDRSVAESLRENLKKSPVRWALSVAASNVTRICPMCFRQGLLHAVEWDRPLTIVCEVHKMCLIDRCPQCQRRISHSRAHPYFCSCGTDLRPTPQSPKPTWIDNFYEVFAPWRMNLLPILTEYDELERRSMTVLLHILWPQTAEQGTPSRRSWIKSMVKLDLRLIEPLGKLFDQWPRNFQRRVLKLDRGSRDWIAHLTRERSQPKLARLRTAIQAAHQARIRYNIFPIQFVDLTKITGMSKTATWRAIREENIKCTISLDELSGAKRVCVSMPDSRRLLAFHRCAVKYSAAASLIGCQADYLRLFNLLGLLPITKYSAYTCTWFCRVKHLRQLLERLAALSVRESLGTESLTRLVDANPHFSNGVPTAPWTKFANDILVGRIQIYLVNKDVAKFASFAVRTLDLPANCRRRSRLWLETISS